MMSSCYSAYSATPGKVMPLDPIGRKTFQATGRSKTNKKIDISRRFLQSNCLLHPVLKLILLLIRGMYGIVGVHASEFTNVRSLGGKGVQTKDSSPTISTPILAWKSLLRRQQLPAEVRPWRHRNHGEKIGHNRVS